MGPNAQPIGVLSAQPMVRQDERLPACTRFLETVANLIAQTIRLMILPTSAQQPAQPLARAERPRHLRACARFWPRHDGR
nr:nitrogenase (molybdenum-iron)-specific transcriptional regulator NifA [Raoultella sp. NCTC 9187]